MMLSMTRSNRPRFAAIAATTALACLPTFTMMGTGCSATEEEVGEVCVYLTDEEGQEIDKTCGTQQQLASRYLDDLTTEFRADGELTTDPSRVLAAEESLFELDHDLVLRLFRGAYQIILEGPSGEVLHDNEHERRNFGSFIYDAGNATVLVDTGHEALLINFSELALTSQEATRFAGRLMIEVSFGSEETVFGVEPFFSEEGRHILTGAVAVFIYGIVAGFILSVLLNEYQSGWLGTLGECNQYCGTTCPANAAAECQTNPCGAGATCTGEMTGCSCDRISWPWEKWEATCNTKRTCKCAAGGDHCSHCPTGAPAACCCGPKEDCTPPE